MKRGLILTGLVLAVLFPVWVRAAYSEARVETRVETNTGQVIINHQVSVATSGGRLQNREEFRENIRDRFQDLQQLWQERLQQIRNTSRRTILEKINNRICQVNQNRTMMMSQHLESMEKILDRVQSKADELKGQGKDTSSVETALTTARQKITDARIAVESQSGRVCTIDITGNETNLGSEVRTAVREFGGELSSVNQKVIAARVAVAQTIQKLAIVLGVKVPPLPEEGE